MISDDSCVRVIQLPVGVMWQLHLYADTASVYTQIVVYLCGSRFTSAGNVAECTRG